MSYLPEVLAMLDTLAQEVADAESRLAEKRYVHEESARNAVVMAKVRFQQALRTEWPGLRAELTGRDEGEAMGGWGWSAEYHKSYEPAVPDHWNWELWECDEVRLDGVAVRVDPSPLLSRLVRLLAGGGQ